MPSRRDLLATLAAVGFAGCTGDPGTGETSSRTPGRTPTGTPRTGAPTTTDVPTESPEANPSDTPAEPSGPAVRWTRDLGGSVRHRPTVHGGTLYVAGGTNANAPPEDREHLRPNAGENVYALSLAGEERWRHEARAGVAGRPRVVADGVHAVGPDGERRWVRSVGEHVVDLHANEAGVVAVRRGTEGQPHGLTALSHDGAERWSFAHPADLTRAAVVGHEAYVGTGSGFVVALG